MCLFLNQLLHPPFQVCLLHGKEEQLPLQNPVEVEGTPTTGCKSMHPSQIVPTDSLGSVALIVTFLMHPS
jgi:hypothetical protein